MKTNKVVSMLILACFLFNTAVSDLAFGLATPSGLDDIVDIQHKDMGRIKFALEEQLVALVHPGLPVNIGTFQTILKQQSVREKTIFQPADMQFFFHETKLTSVGLCVMCRLNDRYGLRTYYATFSLQKDENDGFPIIIYTEEQYKGTAGFTKGTPQVKTEDAKAIDRYIQHEKSVDAVIAYAHEQGLAREPISERFNYKSGVENLLKEIGVRVTNPKGLIPIENRKFYLVKLTKEIQDMISANPAIVVDVKGEEHTVAYYAHSSNDAIHIFVEEDTFELLTDKRIAAWLDSLFKQAVTKVGSKLAYEIGAPLGFPIIAVDKNGMLWNETNMRAFTNDSRKKEFQANPIEVAIVNLDHVKGRDYAAGKLSGENTNPKVAQTAVAESKPIEIQLSMETTRDLGNAGQYGWVEMRPTDDLKNTKSISEFFKLIGQSGADLRILGVVDHRSGQLIFPGLVFNVSEGKPAIRMFADSPLDKEDFTDGYLTLLMWASAGPINFDTLLDFRQLSSVGHFDKASGIFTINPTGAHIAMTASDNVRFIQAQIDKLEAIYKKNTISWGKVEQTEGNKQKVLASIADARHVLSELLNAVDSNPSLARDKNKILQAIELVFNMQGINLRKDLKFYPIHPLQAALNFVQELGITDSKLILSAILHDMIEDVGQFKENPALIGEMFGADVQANVQSVTNWELPVQVKEWLQGLGVSGEAMKVAEYQLGVAREITQSPVALLLKSVDFSNNALKLGNLSGNPQLQARLSAKYGALIQVFAEEFRKLADRESEKKDAANNALVAGLRKKSDTYEAAAQEVTDWARSWDSFGQLSSAMRAVGDVIKIPMGDEESPDIFASWSGIIKEIVRTRLADLGAGEKTSGTSFTAPAAAMDSATHRLANARARVESLRGAEKFSAGVASRNYEAGAPALQAVTANLMWAEHELRQAEKAVRTLSQTASTLPVATDEITTAISLASEAGLQIPTHPNERYNLLVTSEFFANGELEEHKAKYGDRFDLDRVSGRTQEQFIDNILAKAIGKEARTIALVPNDLPAEQLERLTKVGIRFIRVNTADLQKTKVDKDADREKFQVDTYAMMLLLRRIDNSITADSSLYRLLSFYLKSHFALADKVAIDDYITAIVNNDVAKLIKGYLAYRPAQPYEAPDYNKVAATLISA